MACQWSGRNTQAVKRNPCSSRCAWMTRANFQINCLLLTRRASGEDGRSQGSIGPKERAGGDVTCKNVLVQREMESGRFAIASVPPLRGGDFQGMGKSIEVEEEGEDGG